jgi:hypothetical protein
LFKINAKLLQKRTWAYYIRGFIGTVLMEMEKGIGFAASEWEATVSSDLKSTCQRP